MEGYSIKKIKAKNANSIDIHELLKRQINGIGPEEVEFNFGGATGPVDTTAPTPASQTSTTTNQVNFVDSSFYLDSVSKKSLNSGTISFSLSEINKQNSVNEIIRIKVGSFYFPLVSNSTSLPLYYFYRRVYMRIAELPTAQSFLTSQGTGFHFEFDVENVNSIAVLLKPVRDTFNLRQPLQSLDSITFQFMVPPTFAEIPIPQDVLSVVTVNGSNPGRFRIINGDTSSIGSVGTPTAPGVAVFISGVNTNDSTYNNQINSAAGVYVTNIIDSETFEVSSLDFSNATVFPPASSYSGTIVVGKNRIAIPITITSISNTPTTYLQAVNV